MFKNIILILLFFNLINITFCNDYTEVFIVETLPNELNYNHIINNTKSTSQSWLELINSANYSIEIASMYWTMFGDDVMKNPVSESKIGEKIIQSLIDSVKLRSIKLRIAVNDEHTNDFENNKDLNLLKNYSEIRKVNFTRLIGSGVLHTKFIIVDNKDFYVGSANMDWRSLTHVKEFGILIKNNQQLSNDLLKIFNIYWYLGDENSMIPKKWPSTFNTLYNISDPYNIKFNNNDYDDKYNVFITSSPKQFCSTTRTNDLDAIIQIINEAEKFIYISVMDYYPLFLYEKEPHYWPIIDNALRKAVWERNVEIRLLASHWNHTRSYMPLFLKSLNILNDKTIIKGSIDVKLFRFPICPFKNETIPFSEVNHNKYMITDKVIYIGTSNWSADYFISTGGVAIVLNTTNTKQTSSSLYNQTLEIFLRDWNSQYAKNIY